MAYRRLFILVEGSDDERFVFALSEPLKAIAGYDHIQPYAYANAPTKKVEGLIRSIRNMEGAEYVYCTDLNDSPCIQAKKRKLQDSKGFLDASRIIVVVPEIEAWYVAGLNDQAFQALGIRPQNCTDDVTKEVFNHLKPRRFRLRLDFTQELLKHFQIRTARQHNRSFDYFMGKLEQLRTQRETP